MEGKEEFIVAFEEKFARDLKRLSKEIQTLVQKRISVFCANPFSVQLRTHKLRGRLLGHWAFSVNYDYRIIFYFEHPKTIILEAIGPHDLYERFR